MTIHIPAASSWLRSCPSRATAVVSIPAWHGAECQDGNWMRLSSRGTQFKGPPWCLRDRRQTCTGNQPRPGPRARHQGGRVRIPALHRHFSVVEPPIGFLRHESRPSRRSSRSATRKRAEENAERSGLLRVARVRGLDWHTAPDVHVHLRAEVPVRARGRQRLRAESAGQRASRRTVISRARGAMRSSTRRRSWQIPQLWQTRSLTIDSQLGGITGR